MGGENQNEPGASQQNQETTPKVEIKDGATFIDGKKYVLESDLIAAKKSVEGDRDRAYGERDTAKLDLGKAQESVASLTAQLEEAKKAREAGGSSEEELSRIKGELETAKGSLATLTAQAGKALEYRRELIARTYGVTPDTIKDKTMAELDSFEEALQTVAKMKGGPGPYALGAQGGQTGLEGKTPMQLAQQAYANKS